MDFTELPISDLKEHRDHLKSALEYPSPDWVVRGTLKLIDKIDTELDRRELCQAGAVR